MEELLELIQEYGTSRLEEGRCNNPSYPDKERVRLIEDSEGLITKITKKIKERIILHNVAMDMYECTVEALDRIIEIEDNPNHETNSLFFLNKAIGIAGNAKLKAQYMAYDHQKGKEDEQSKTSN